MMEVVMRSFRSLHSTDIVILGGVLIAMAASTYADDTVQSRGFSSPSVSSSPSLPSAVPMVTPAGPSPVPVPYPIVPSRLSPDLNAISSMFVEGRPANVILEAWKNYVTRRVKAKQPINVDATINDVSVNAKARLNADIERRQAQLNAMGDDAQLANVDLQNQLQKQQQAMQMLSNILKMMHDTAMAIIRNLKG
jgi:hypothetical protein